jgi:predicted nucleotidyltransferase
MTTLSKELPGVIQGVLQKIIDEYTPQKIILFGSFAHGNSGSDSDIDLLIIKETPERFIDRWTMVQKILTGTHPSIPVETFIFTPDEIEQRINIGDQFIKEVLDTGEVLYAT